MLEVALCAVVYHRTHHLLHNRHPLHDMYMLLHLTYTWYAYHPLTNTINVKLLLLLLSHTLS